MRRGAGQGETGAPTGAGEVGRRGVRAGTGASRWRRWRWVLWAAATVAADQLAKVWVQTFLAPGESVALIGPILRLTHVRNSGAAFGLLAGQGPVFMVATAAVLALAVAWTLRSGALRAGTVAGLGLVSGGALANLVDRLRQGAVVDFIDVGLWPVFNLADAAIVTGVGLLLWHLLGRSEPRGGHARCSG